MAPENEGKPAALSGSVVEVRYEDIQEMQTTLARMQAKVEEVMSKLSVVEVECKTEPGETDGVSSRRSEELRGLVKDLEYANTYGQLVRLKLGNLVARVKGPEGESDVLKRSRPMSHELSRVPSLVDSKLGILGSIVDGADSCISKGGGFDGPLSAAGDKLPLKFIRTENNTKAAYQKPQIYMPTPKLGVPNLDGPATGDPPTLSSGGMLAKSPTSPRKRPSRCRRDRNRAKNRVAAAPEPVMQRLMPGDTNKIPEDGYLWRKYGNKPIKTASYKRGYYKCRHFKEVRCNATKIVQQTNNDPSTFSVCYKGEHTCQQGKLGNRNLSGVSRGDSDATLADQVHETAEDMGNTIATDGERDEASLLEMDWPRDDDDASESSDMEFPADEAGEEPVDSAVVPAPDMDLPVTAQPASPPLVLDFGALENIPDLASGNMFVDRPPSSITAPEQQVAPWAPVEAIPVPVEDTLAKSKYQPIETCPPLDDQVEKDVLMSADDNDHLQLLKIIQEGFLDDYNDISFWSNAPFGQSYATDSF